MPDYDEINKERNGPIMPEPKRYTLKLKEDIFDKVADLMETIEDSEGQWIFDPGHKIELPSKDTQTRLRCAFLDEVCVHCEEDCPAAGGINKKR